MPDFDSVEISFVAEVSYLSGRGRVPRKVRVAGSVAAPVRIATRSEAPVVFRSPGPGGLEGDVVLRRDLDGAVVAPAYPSGRPAGFGWKGAIEGARGYGGASSVLSGKSQPWDDWGHRWEEALPADADRVVADGRIEARDAVLKAAANLCVLDGELWATRPEPVLRLATRSLAARGVMTTRAFDRFHGYSFRADRIADMREFARRNSYPGGLTAEGDWPEPEILDMPLRYREGVDNAMYAGVSALRSVQHLAFQPSEAFPAMGRVRAALEALDEGRDVSAEMDAALAALDGIRPRMGRAVLLKNMIRIGRDSIASSLRPEDPDFDPLLGADLDALEELGRAPSPSLG